MTSLADFLLQCIAADEAAARAEGERRAAWAEQYRGAGVAFTEWDIGPGNPAHVLATCEAHRRIVELHTDDWLTCPSCAVDGEYDRISVEHPCPTLRALAAIYADRDGFREEWR